MLICIIKGDAIGLFFSSTHNPLLITVWIVDEVLVGLIVWHLECVEEVFIEKRIVGKVTNVQMEFICEL